MAGNLPDTRCDWDETSWGLMLSLPRMSREGFYNLHKYPPLCLFQIISSLAWAVLNSGVKERPLHNVLSQRNQLFSRPHTPVWYVKIQSGLPASGWYEIQAWTPPETCERSSFWPHLEVNRVAYVLFPLVVWPQSVLSHIRDADAGAPQRHQSLCLIHSEKKTYGRYYKWSPEAVNWLQIHELGFCVNYWCGHDDLLGTVCGLVFPQSLMSLFIFNTGGYGAYGNFHCWSYNLSFVHVRLTWGRRSINNNWTCEAKSWCTHIKQGCSRVWSSVKDNSC